MKIFFIASSVYILYLMYAKYKATYDAGLDTFRIEYLLVVSAVLGVATTSLYTVNEVSTLSYLLTYIDISLQDIMDFLNLVRISRDFTTIVHVTKDRRSRDDHDALFVCFGSL